MSFRASLLPSDREHFSMGETSRITQVSPHTLRYWEERIGLLRPARRSSGHRRYNREDLETILFIKDLISQRKMTVLGARRALLERRRSKPPAALSDPAGPVDTAPATLRLLRELRKEINTLVEELR